MWAGSGVALVVNPRVVLVAESFVYYIISSQSSRVTTSTFLLLLTTNKRLCLVISHTVASS